MANSDDVVGGDQRASIKVVADPKGQEWFVLRSRARNQASPFEYTLSAAVIA